MAHYKLLTAINTDYGTLYLTENLYRRLNSISVLTLNIHFNFKSSTNNPPVESEWIDVSELHHTDFRRGRIKGSIYYKPAAFEEDVVYDRLFTSYVFFNIVKEARKEP